MPTRSSSSAWATMLSRSPYPLGARLDTRERPRATPCSALAAPSSVCRKAPPPRPNESPAPPAPAPLPFLLPAPAPRALQNFLSSNPPASLVQSLPANIFEIQSAPSCWRCNRLQSREALPRFAQCPGQSFPPDECQTACPWRRARPTLSPHLSTASRFRIRDRPCSPSAKYPPAHLQFFRVSRENISGS